MATRRQVIGQLALGLGVMACRAACGQPAEQARFVGITTSATTGRSQTAFFTETGAALPPVALDFRAHGMARHDNRLVVFPRRPGDRFAVVNLQNLEIIATVKAPADRHFYGHGAFSQDGGTLLVTENDLETLQGAIGIYDVRPKPRRLGHIDLPGAGPHDILRVAQSGRFLVALGGLETHPDYGRTPLNLSSFRSELVELDIQRGTATPLGFWTGSDGISLRHLAQDSAGRIYVGGQVADMARAKAENVLWLVDGQAKTMVAAGARLAGYVSSVAAHGTQAVVSSKTAHQVVTLDGPNVIGAHRIDGASAVAVGPYGSAMGGYAKLLVNETVHHLPAGLEYDNHGLALL